MAETDRETVEELMKLGMDISERLDGPSLFSATVKGLRRMTKGELITRIMSRFQKHRAASCRSVLGNSYDVKTMADALRVVLEGLLPKTVSLGRPVATVDLP